MMRMQTIDMLTSNACRFTHGRQLFSYTSMRTQKGCYFSIEAPFLS